MRGANKQSNQIKWETI